MIIIKIIYFLGIGFYFIYILNYLDKKHPEFAQYRKITLILCLVFSIIWPICIVQVCIEKIFKINWR